MLATNGVPGEISQGGQNAFGFPTIATFELARRSGEAADLAACVDEARRQAASDIAGGT
jgi:hypothetical protein